MSIAVYPRCIRLAFGGEDGIREFEEELRAEISCGDAACCKSGEVWVGDVRLGSFPIVTAQGHKLILVHRSGTSVICHHLESGKREPRVSSEDVTNTLIHMFFVTFRATLWHWAEECIRKLGGLSQGKIKVNWKQALLGQGLEGEEWASSDAVHVWNLLRKCILTEIWWVYNRSLVEDTKDVTAKYLVQQIWLGVRLYIILEWLQVVKSKDDDLARRFDRRWLQNGFAGMRTRDWVLWMWEEPLLISKLSI